MYTLRQSQIDPLFFEVHSQDGVVQEIKIPFRIRKIPAVFYDLQEIEKWLKDAEWKLAKSYAYFLLAKKSYSSASLLQKLERKCFSSFVCEELIKELTRLGFLSDDVFFQALILKMAKQGYGPLYIAKKIQFLGGAWKRDSMDAELRKLALSKALLRLKGKPLEKRKMALLRRGFEWADLKGLSQ